MGEPALPRWQAALVQAWWRRPPSALAWALWPLSQVYRLLAALHRGVARGRAQAAPVPVIVVGNLIAGGAGKTPTVLAVVAALRAMGFAPGVISRGYGRAASGVAEVAAASRASEVGDEPLLIHRRGAVPVAVGRDRIAAARLLCGAHPRLDLLVSDDGLQHHRLARTVQVIVFDDRGAGNGLLLPAGPLREPLPRQVPPCTLVLYNAQRPSTPLPGWCARRRIGGVAALADWWQGAPPSPQLLQALCGRRVVAAAGIAAPERFFSAIEAEGLEIDRLPLPDHADLASMPWPPGTADVVVTEKDAVKLDPGRTGPTRVWVATLDFALDPGFVAALAAALREAGLNPHPS